MPFRSRSLTAFRAMLGLSALDSAASGAWAMLRPEQVFAFLHIDVHQGAFLLRGLGVLLLIHALCLIAAAARPEAWGGLVWAPLLGRLLNGGVWLWLLGAARIAVDPGRLLLAHEALWLPGFVVFLALRGRRLDAQSSAARGPAYTDEVNHGQALQ